MLIFRSRLFSRCVVVTALAACWQATAAATLAGDNLVASPAGSSCTQLLQAQDKQAVAACRAQLEEAEKGPATERMARIVAEDEYGVALLGIGHQPRPALDAFDHAVALLPASTVKPDSLQWAVTFWHRATAYQQLSEWAHASADLGTAEASLSDGITAAAGNAALQEHLAQLRHRVRVQHAGILEHLGRHSEAQKLLATQ